MSHISNLSALLLTTSVVLHPECAAAEKELTEQSANPVASPIGVHDSRPEWKLRTGFTLLFPK